MNTRTDDTAEGAGWQTPSRTAATLSGNMSPPSATERRAGEDRGGYPQRPKQTDNASPAGRGLFASTEAGPGLRTAVVFPACFYMPNLAPLCMVWGGVISNENITAKTRRRGNRSTSGNFRPWGFPQPFPYRMQTATRAGRLSFVCRAGVCRYGYGMATALRICSSTAERLVSRRAVCIL